MGPINRTLSSEGMRAASRGLALALALLFSLGAAQESRAQSPNAAATGAAKSDDGFYPGWSLGTRFEGSTSGDGSVYDLGFGGGYNFSHHFGVNLGISFYFVWTPSTMKTKNPQAVSGSRFGHIRAEFKWGLSGPNPDLRFTSHL